MIKESEIRDGYQRERRQYVAATPEARQKIDEDAAHDVAVDLGLDPGEVARVVEDDRQR